MKKTIINKLIIWLVVAIILSACVLTVLMRYNRQASEKATSELGAMYMSEMMFQMQDHFETIIDIKNKETEHIAEHAANEPESDYREALYSAAQYMDFEYLALYDEAGNYEMILGEDAWYRDLNGFINKVIDGETVATTGYQTSTGGKYIVFGVPAQYRMKSGQTSTVMLAGFSVEKLYEYIQLDEFEQVGGNADVWIILTNGSYVLKSSEIVETSFFDHINNFGSFVGMDIKDGVDFVEKAMACGNSFSNMVSLNGEVQHIYGASAGEPEDWYFVISMPQGITDEVITAQNKTIIHAFLAAGAIILLLFLSVFLFYMRWSMKQIRETEDARAEAETANLAKSTFLSNMSHDIRTPMNAIVGFTSLALKEKDGSIVHNYLRKIATSSNHLLLLINEVLEMSRIESGKVVLDETVCSLSTILEDIKTLIGRKAEEKKQILTISSDIQDNNVYCDRLRMNQILMNLVGNAIKYTPEGGHISVMLQQKECDEKAVGAYEIIVADDGIGMSKDFTSRAFDAFEREYNSTASGIEGTGLGLSIVKNIVDVMGGTITLQTELQHGATFTVNVKLRISEEKAQQSYETEEEKIVWDTEQMKRFFEGKKILLVEDNEFNREITGTLLEKAGFLIDVAEEGEIAVNKVKNAPVGYYDAILMDIQMPVMNGYEAAKAIRSLEGERSKVRIIAVTANAFESDRKQVMEAGMNSYISKPIDVEKLYEELRKLM